MYEGVPTEEHGKTDPDLRLTSERARAYCVVLFRLLTTEVQRASIELWQDVCAFGWRRIASPLAIAGWLAALVCAIVFAASPVQIDSFCSPSDQFTTEEQDYSLWHISDTFQITRAFGNLTFAEAKLIDIAFDIVVGRGGQALLALVTYYVFKRYLMSAMATTPTSYGVYKGIFLNESISLAGTCRLIGEFWRFKPLASAAAMTWIILSAAFIVSFSTLASAMTGYKPISEAFVQDGNGNYLAFDGLSQIAYTIHDASRLNLTTLESLIFTQNPANITTGQDALTDPYVVRLPRSSKDCVLPMSWATRPMDNATLQYFDCFLCHLISEYVANYGFYGTNQTATWLRGQNLSSPALNVSAFYVTESSVSAPYLPYNASRRSSNSLYAWNGTYDFRNDYLFGHGWVDPRTNKTPFSDSSKTVYTTAASSSSSSSNLTLSLGDKSTQGRCQPSGNGRFAWGFSFILLFICLTLIIIWTVGSTLMLLAAGLYSDSAVRESVTTQYKAIVELSNAMDDEFHKNGEDLQGLSGRSIREFIKTDLKGGKMKTQAQETNRERQLKHAMLPWLRENKWWTTSFCSAAILMSILLGLSSHSASAMLGGIFFAFVAFAVLFARFVGKQKRSRWLSTFILFVAGLITVICGSSSTDGI